VPSDPDPRAWLDRLRNAAADRAAAGLRRRLAPRPPGDGVVDMAGNDYLGLASHPLVRAAAHAALDDYGLGATGSRLVRGTTDAHAALEADLAGWLGTGGALVYSSGYLANLGALRALAPGRESLVVSDAYNHASLVDGCRATRASVVVVPHLDLDAMDKALRTADGRPATLVTESVFSVDGDLAPLAEMHALARRHGARLLVDDAHGAGLLGPDGAGGVVAAGIAGEPDVVVTVTLSKSFGGAGGVVAGPSELIGALIDTGRTFIYDTAPPPSVAAGTHAALRIMRSPEGAARRAELHARAAEVVGVLGGAGLSVSHPAAGVLSVMAAGPEEALAWAAACRERGVAVGCFRPPSTPDGSSRLRLTINAGVDRAAFDEALRAIVATRPAEGR
jgi:8-amino-7-oxononanoate synthase